MIKHQLQVNLHLLMKVIQIYIKTTNNYKNAKSVQKVIKGSIINVKK